MDLESELRQAMAEQVAGTTAPASLVADVKRRHRRRKARIHAAAGAAAATVAALALVPTYQSFRATPAGNPGTARTADGGPTLEQPERPPAPGSSASPSAKGEPRAGASSRPEAHPSAGRSADGPRKPGPGGVVDGLPGWITYIPDGLTAAGPCTVTGGAERETTTCKWRGSAGWLEIAMVKGSGLTGPRDLMKSPGLPGHTSVRGAPALTADRPGSGRQISWLARPGVGVTVSAGGSVETRLMRVAEGVRP
ncbi:hypothetical protein [Actinomadura livida]|uniref:Uncharacterized protein n=1 Tax=Actinomadura livida TaxID=79909 RepID=A0A7W7IJP7_9ACTN|nr:MULTISPECIES: hypothetical protein [Actinomadura]MBB4778270.1 hypothetical protein [Actinomadura catellatispora]GGU25773.1 hypothetical protein GCM10010208_58430 [Actinomadura livida]